MDLDNDVNGEEYESVTVDILGTYLRVRVPAERKSDVLEAAAVVEKHIDAVRRPSDPPLLAITRAALELAFESLSAKRDARDRLTHLSKRFEAALGD
ncbi:MAG: cell division protein ZapA [Candidatus Poribacteria bacterium]|nr:cell division protein ZapA [Candidatus Poribacteria bacterium]